MKKMVNVANAYQLTEEEEYFLRTHQEIRDLLPHIRGTYRHCQGKQLDGKIVDIVEAYYHIFGKVGYGHGCEGCKKFLTHLRKKLGGQRARTVY